MAFLLFILLIIITNSFSKISEEYTNLINWIEKNNGYISKKVKPIEESKYNRIIKSSEKIKKDELIAYIPEKLVISSINYKVNPFCQKAYGLHHTQDLDCIALFLTLDTNNQSSFFKPYYDYFPEFDIKIFPSEFPKEEQKLYEEIDLHFHISVHDYKLQQAYNEYVEEILLKYKIENSYEKYKYYFYLSQTRNFARPNSKFFSDINSMVPFMDLFNHNINFNLDWEYDDDKKGFLIKAVKDIESNKELTTTYGNEDNINLFVVYGFTLKNNKYKVPIRIKIGENKYSLYPSDDENINKKEIRNLIGTLKEKYGREKDKEILINKLILNGLKEKFESIKKIKLDNVNIKNIIEEEIINLSRFIYIVNENIS